LKICNDFDIVGCALEHPEVAAIVGTITEGRFAAVPRFEKRLYLLAAGAGARWTMRIVFIFCLSLYAND